MFTEMILKRHQIKRGAIVIGYNADFLTGAGSLVYYDFLTN